MDNTKQFTAIEWCAGYGGIHLGLKRAIPNLRVIAYGEIEAFAVANLVAKMEAGLMDAAPIWSDLKTFPCEDFRDRVDLLVAGYPCQPFSAAGKRLGTDDPRHLWPHIARSIRVIRPRMCFFENVEGHISLGLREVVGELEQIGYQTAFGIFSAREVGAPHQRKRVFILAHLKCAGLEGLYKWYTPSEQTEFVGADSGASCQRSAWEGCELEHARVSSENSHAAQCWGWDVSRQGTAGQSSCGTPWPSRPGEPQHGWEPPRVVAGRKIMDDTQERCLRIDGENQRAPDGDGNTPNITSHGGGAGEGELAGVVANSVIVGRRGRCDGDAGGLCGEIQTEGSCGSGGGEVSGNAAMFYGAGQARGQREAQAWRTGATQHDRQAQPSLGGDAHGPADRMDYAELCVTCDNRTDELRLLGNGVVPATAERAFRILIEELFKQQKE